MWKKVTQNVYSLQIHAFVYPGFCRISEGSKLAIFSLSGGFTFFAVDIGRSRVVSGSVELVSWFIFQNWTVIIIIRLIQSLLNFNRSLIFNSHLSVQNNCLWCFSSTFQILKLLVNILSIFHYSLKFICQLIHCLFVIFLLGCGRIKGHLFSWDFRRRHVPRSNLLAHISIFNCREYLLTVKTICYLFYLFGVASSATEHLIWLMIRHLWFTKTGYVFSIVAKG